MMKNVGNQLVIRGLTCVIRVNVTVTVDRLEGAAETLQAFLSEGSSVSTVKIVSADSPMSLH